VSNKCYDSFGRDGKEIRVRLTVGRGFGKKGIDWVRRMQVLEALRGLPNEDCVKKKTQKKEKRVKPLT